MAVEHSQCGVTLSVSLFLSPWKLWKIDFERVGVGPVDSSSGLPLITRFSLKEGGFPLRRHQAPGPYIAAEPAVLLGCWGHLREIHYGDAL